MRCVPWSYLFISDGGLQTAPTFYCSAAPNWNQISGRPGGAGCFFRDLEEKLDKEEGDFMVWGFKEEKKMKSELVVDFSTAAGWQEFAKHNKQACVNQQIYSVNLF